MKADLMLTTRPPERDTKHTHIPCMKTMYVALFHRQTDATNWCFPCALPPLSRLHLTSMTGSGTRSGGGGSLTLSLPSLQPPRRSHHRHCRCRRCRICRATPYAITGFLFSYDLIPQPVPNNCRAADPYQRRCPQAFAHISARRR